MRECNYITQGLSATYVAGGRHGCNSRPAQMSKAVAAVSHRAALFNGRIPGLQESIGEAAMHGKVPDAHAPR